MSESADDILANAGAFRDRLQDREVVPGGRIRRRRGDSPRARLALIAAANVLILIAASIVGLVLPLGIFGALAVMLLMVAATVGIAFMPLGRPPSFESLRAAPVAQLPRQTARWLHSQRAALPAPAVTLADQIGARLNELEPQLATLDPEAPAANEIRKLVGEQLPDFVKGYTAVPTALRGQPRNGQTPDAQLLDGLTVIDEQLALMSAQLAQGDLDNLSTRGRYLQIRYRGDDAA